MASNGRVAIVTGASGGIGRATAERLARDGFAVVVGYSGNADRAGEAVAAITAAGGAASAFQADIADEAEAAALFDHAEATYGGVDVVINAAGIMILAPLIEMNLDDFDHMFRINVRGTFIVTQLAARHVREGGAVINFSTTVAKTAYPTYSAYAATKGAVEAATLIFAREMRGRDVTVNAVAPGPTATPLFFEGKTPEQIAASTNAAPLGRLGEPADIAEVVSFLAGPGRWVNGQVVYANGGVA